MTNAVFQGVYQTKVNSTEDRQEISPGEHHTHNERDSSKKDDDGNICMGERIGNEKGRNWNDMDSEAEPGTAGMNPFTIEGISELTTKCANARTEWT